MEKKNCPPKPSSGPIPGPDAGFTLVEMLVALVIASFLLLGFLSVLRAGLNVYRKTDENSAETHDARLFLSLLEAELRNAVVYSGAPFEGKERSFSFPALIDQFDEEEIHKIPVLVSYEYREKSLYRKQTPLRGIFLKNRADAKKTLSAVKSFVVQYAYRKESGSEIVWREEWPDGIGLPRGVQVRFALEPPAKKRQEPFWVERRFFIPHGNWGRLQE
ncbi:MAG: prepilin-type N-terminal cleavage/methylation domain-containing protein [Candidatus Omnitrophica bacterium]|nr:prepilin-type N-terminal cleavage/methylation domain-containing protein [Candidatus Omnitrophota bacterium]